MAVFNSNGTTFNTAPGESPNDRLRLFDIIKSWQEFPGRAPNGSGSTGLTSNDAQGWSNILNDQSWAMGQMSKEPLNTREAPLRERHVNPLGGVPAFDPQFTGRYMPRSPLDSGPIMGLKKAYS